MATASTRPVGVPGGHAGGGEPDRPTPGVDDVVGEASLPGAPRVELHQRVGPHIGQSRGQRGDVELCGGRTAVAVLHAERDHHRLLRLAHRDPALRDRGPHPARGEDVGDDQAAGRTVGVVGGGQHVQAHRGCLGVGAEGVEHDGRVVVRRGRAQRDRGLRGVDAVAEPVDDLEAAPPGQAPGPQRDRAGRGLQADPRRRVDQLQRRPIPGGDHVVGQRVHRRGPPGLDRHHVGQRERRQRAGGRRDRHPDRAGRPAAPGVGQQVVELVGADAPGIGLVLDRGGRHLDHAAHGRGGGEADQADGVAVGVDPGARQLHRDRAPRGDPALQQRRLRDPVGLRQRDHGDLDQAGRRVTAGVRSRCSRSRRSAVW